MYIFSFPGVEEEEVDAAVVEDAEVAEVEVEVVAVAAAAIEIIKMPVVILART